MSATEKIRAIVGTTIHFPMLGAVEYLEDVCVIIESNGTIAEVVPKEIMDEALEEKGIRADAVY